MAAKTAPKKPAAKPKGNAANATSHATVKKVAPVALTLVEHQENAVAAIEKGLDLLAEKIGDAGRVSITGVGPITVHQLRDEFDKVKFHEPFRVLFALARGSAK